MSWFSFGKKKEIEKKVVCARCKQVITDGNEEWIGNHRFCRNCAKAPDSSKTVPHCRPEAVRENCSAPDLNAPLRISHEGEEKLVKRSRRLFTICEDRTKWSVEWVGYDPETNKNYRICQEAYPYGHTILDRYSVHELTKAQVAELARKFAPDSQYAAAKRTEQKDKTVPSDRIVIQEICPPSHAGETEFGYSLVCLEEKWQFELSYFRAEGSGVSGNDYFDIPPLLWDGPVYEGLNRFVIKVAHHDPGIKGRDTCKEWQKLEYLFDTQKKFRVRKEQSFCLHHQGDTHQGMDITLHFRADGTIEVTNTGWWPAHIGASNGGQVSYPLEPALFALGSVEDLIRILSEKERDVDFSKLAHREDILALFQ